MSNEDKVTAQKWVRNGIHIDTCPQDYLKTRRIVKIMPGNGLLGSKTEKLSGHEQVEIADLIVRAVNSHDDLVAALKVLMGGHSIDGVALAKAALAKAWSEDEQR